MKIYSPALILLLLTSCGNAKSDLVSRVQFASLEKAKQLLTTEDDFTRSWSEFDIHARLQRKDGTKAELLEFIASQAQEWTKEEKDKLTNIVKDLDKVISENGYKINMPGEIYFVKTTAKEEDYALGYTRSNYIVLMNEIIKQPDSIIRVLVAHELFHVVSRNDENFRKQMYDIIGFKMMKPVSFPDAIKDLKITNPDATQTDTYITLQNGVEPVDVMMLNYAKEKYDTGGFFQYLNFGFLKLSRNDHTVDIVNNNPVIYKLDSLGGFHEQIGSNTQYIIHPEEIMADNFALLLNNKKDLPSPWILEKMKQVLK